MKHFLTILLFISCLNLNPAQTTAPIIDLALKYRMPCLYPKGVPFAEKYADQVAKETGKRTEAYAYAIGLRGEFYLRIRKIKEAESDLLESLDLYKKRVPDGNLVVATVNHNLGSILLMMGNMERSESFL